MKRKKSKKALIAVLSVIVLLTIAVIVVVSKMSKSLGQIESPNMAGIDLANIADGVYSGSYSALPLSAKVEVVVSGHRITGINVVEHYHGRGAIAEAVTDKVVESQSVEVDAVSGATYSSKVILKAIEDALR